MTYKIASNWEMKIRKTSQKFKARVWQRVQKVLKVIVFGPGAKKKTQTHLSGQNYNFHDIVIHTIDGFGSKIDWLFT